MTPFLDRILAFNFMSSYFESIENIFYTKKEYFFQKKKKTILMRERKVCIYLLQKQS